MTVPAQPKIYHIAHCDRLPSIIEDGCLWRDAEMSRRSRSGTAIGMRGIKKRRLEKKLGSRPDLHVGDCVPFYFAPRSIMLYIIHQANHPELSYTGGQDPVIHLEFDLHAAVEWADGNNRRWVFTSSRAASGYFEDYSDLARLDKIDWEAVQARRWSGDGIPSSVKEGKQAEFLLEKNIPWKLVDRIGVCADLTYNQVANTLAKSPHKPKLEIKTDWYY